MAAAGNHMRLFARGFLALREIGPGKLLQLAFYRTLLRSGWMRHRTPIRSWRDQDLKDILRVGVPSDPVLYADFKRTENPLVSGAACASRLYSSDIEQSKLLREQVEAILRGEYPAFGLLSVDGQFPPDWHTFLPLGETGQALTVDPRHHWTQYSVTDLPADVKLVWELSRFGWVYPMVRAYAVLDEERALRGSLELIRDWMKHNPPNAGPQWMSAQEAALRILACAFLVQGAADALRSEDWEMLAKFVDAHARRIPPTWSYARAQDNNHLLVEAAGLLTAGLLFPELKGAAEWEATGRVALERGFQRQVFADGGYVQHSHTYARMALQVGLWTVFLGRCTGRPMSADLEDALRRLATALFSIMDRKTGRTPNFGPNDGVYARPLSMPNASDFRPVVQAAFLVLDGKPAFPEGLWDEEACWLGWEGKKVEDGVSDAPVEMSPALPDAGLYRLGDDDDWAVLRCASFRTRPGHADQLHVDIWHQGENILLDPGTYQYNAAPPWDNALVSAHVHNTAWLEGREPMQRAGRFLWLDWDQGRLLGWWRSPQGLLEAVCAEHGDSRRMKHRRTLVRLERVGWLVVDDFLGSGQTRIQHGWNLMGEGWQLEGDCVSSQDTPPVRLCLDETGDDIALIKGGRGSGQSMIDPIKGWYAPTYACRLPCTRVAVTAEDKLPFRRSTWLLLNERSRDSMDIAWRTVSDHAPSLQSLYMDGERLELTDAYLINPPGFRRAG